MNDISKIFRLKHLAVLYLLKHLQVTTGSPHSITSTMATMTILTTVVLYVLPILVLPILYSRSVFNILLKTICLIKLLPFDAILIKFIWKLIILELRKR